MRFSVAAACLSLCLIGFSSADDAHASIRKETNIPGEGLGPALNALAKDRNFQIVYVTEEIADVRTEGAVGDFTIEEALKRLLTGTGLTYRYLDDKTVTIGSASAPQVRSGSISQTTLSSGSSENANANQEGKKSSSREFRVAQAASGQASGAASVDQRPQNQPQDNSSALQEIIVTANKRKENIQDVPISITALSGQQLEQTGPQSLADIAGLVPGLTVSSGGTPGETQIVLRGIATGGLSFGSLVGTYIDELPVGSTSGMARGAQFAPDLMPYDLERIEVLNGPQGTLYGASSMGGLIKYVLKDPDLTGISGRVGGIVEYMDRSGAPGGGGRAAINLPLIDGVFGIRISGYDQKTQGFIDNVSFGNPHYNPYTQQGGRFVALWNASDVLSVKFSAMFQNIDAHGSSDVTVDPSTLQNMFGDFTRATSAPESFVQHSQFYSLAINWNLGFATLLSASGWQKALGSYQADTTPLYGQYSPVPNTVSPFNGRFSLNDKFTEELRLTSPASQGFEWMLGAFYTHEGTENYQNLGALSPTLQPLPGLDPFFIGVFPATYDEIAGYLNGTYHFNDRFSVGAGARYSGNRQESSEIEYGGLLGNLNAPIPTYARSSQDVTTWMISPEWHVNRDAMVYARVATGYRPGGWTFAAPPAPQSYKADSTTNYEVGLKSTFLEQHLVFNAALYDIQWKDMQVSFQDPTTKLIYLNNAGSARSRGTELELSYRPNDSLHLGTTFGYTDALVTSTKKGSPLLDGDRLPLSAKFNGAVTADFKQSMPGNWALREGVALRYSSSIWTGTSGGFETGAGTSSASDAILVQQPHPVDLYAAAMFDHYEVRLFARNIFTSEPRVTFLRDPAYWNTNELTYTTLAPATVGLNFEASF